MKCLILAGGQGDRLWPLSRRNYPKQFIELQKNHSIFQETVARNLPFCDEFIISTSKEYQFIVEDQMQAFSSTPYRCILEETGRKTTASIVLACMEMERSELIFVVASDQLISGESYKDCVLRAREYAKQGKLVTIGMPPKNPKTHFGYIRFEGETVLEFTEKPDEKTMVEYVRSGNYLINSGMFLFQTDVFLHEVRRYDEAVYRECLKQFHQRSTEKGNTFYSIEQLRKITPVAVEKTVFEKTKESVVVHGEFSWTDVGTFADLYETDSGAEDFGEKIQHECENTNVINRCDGSIVVADGLENVTIINTKDAVYVGKSDRADNLKLLAHEGERTETFFEKGVINYRGWGTYEILADAPHYRVKRVLIRTGKTIYSHKHQYRSEQWAIVQGEAKIELDGEERNYLSGETLTVGKNVFHQVSNIGKETLIIIEVASGENVCEEDLVSERRLDLTDCELGFDIDPFVHMQPVFQDYLWGGTRLRDLYGKKCDYDMIAESWELSAHPAGTSFVYSGRHRGMRFSNYLEVLGKKYWGWKCKSNSLFPILIKFIDAKQDLSIQVHPDDDYALEKENEYGKNEMWYIVDSAEGAGLYCGFKYDISREEVENRIRNNTILDVLNWIPTKAGDTFFIPAGTVHAIGAGNLICEIQQSSNVTYRLYDYNRKDKYGNCRELHVEKALDVLDYKKYLPQILGNSDSADIENQHRLLAECKYFTCEEIEVKDETELSQVETSFTAIICVDGHGHMKSNDHNAVVREGDCFFLPAGNKRIVLEGKCKVLVVKV